MFRRKEEGTEDIFKEAPTDVQVPPAPESSSESTASASTPASPSSEASSATAPASFGSGFSAPTAASYGSAKPTNAAATPAAPASPYRAAGSPAAGSANVTDISNRNRFADNNRTTSSNTTLGSLGMDKTAAKTGSKNRVLTVGNDILLKGEINTCDRIVIEGAVDATLKDVHTMEIAESGSFKGIAEVEEAEISGTVEGDLTVRGRLIIYSSGKVSGKITYGEIEIERGGQLTGEIKAVDAAASGSKSKAAAA